MPQWKEHSSNCCLYGLEANQIPRPRRGGSSIDIMTLLAEGPRVLSLENSQSQMTALLAPDTSRRTKERLCRTIGPSSR